MTRYMIVGLIGNDCREIVRTSGLADGKLLGYVIRRPWSNCDQWFAYRLAGDNLAFVGRFAEPDEAAKAVG